MTNPLRKPLDVNLYHAAYSKMRQEQPWLYRAIDPMFNLLHERVHENICTHVWHAQHTFPGRKTY